MSLSFDKRPILVTGTDKVDLPDGRKNTLITFLADTVIAAIEAPSGLDGIAGDDFTGVTFSSGLAIIVEAKSITLASGAVLLQMIQ